MSKLFERHEAREHRLPDTTEALPELPDDVTVPDDVSALTHPETAIGHPASGIRWMRWSSLAILLVAGAIVAALTLRSDETADNQTVFDLSEVAAYAEANGLTGLSPASLTEARISVFDLSEVAAYAEANGLTGLSPASLTEARISVFDLSEVAAYAEANGLTGLSPASLTEARISVFDLSEVAAYAEANGLTGLSPASLTEARISNHSSSGLPSDRTVR